MYCHVNPVFLAEKKSENKQKGRFNPRLRAASIAEHLPRSAPGLGRNTKAIRNHYLLGNTPPSIPPPLKPPTQVIVSFQPAGFATSENRPLTMSGAIALRPTLSPRILSRSVVTKYMPWVPRRKLRNLWPVHGRRFAAPGNRGKGLSRGSLLTTVRRAPPPPWARRAAALAPSLGLSVAECSIAASSSIFFPLVF